MKSADLDDLIARNWTEMVRSDDEIWHIGDIGSDWRRVGGLPGRKHLILAHASDRRAAIRNSGIFATIQDTAVLECDRRNLFLIHNPDQPRLGPSTDVIHGHHHYRPPEQGCFSACVDHGDWRPVRLRELIGG